MNCTKIASHWLRYFTQEAAQQQNHSASFDTALAIQQRMEGIDQLFCISPQDYPRVTLDSEHHLQVRLMPCDPVVLKRNCMANNDTIQQYYWYRPARIAWASHYIADNSEFNRPEFHWAARFDSFRQSVLVKEEKVIELSLRRQKWVHRQFELDGLEEGTTRESAELAHGMIETFDRPEKYIDSKLQAYLTYQIHLDRE